VRTLLAVPNFSEGRDRDTIDAIGRAFGEGLLDVHADADHNRSVFTVAGRQGELARRVADAAAEAIKLTDLSSHSGVHPRVGAIDVAPIVYLKPSDRGSACAEALVLGDLLGEELRLPVLLYGELAAGRTRAELRRGGPAQLTRRLNKMELVPDFGPREMHPTAGAVLVGARPPLVAFNLELDEQAGLEDAQRIAGAIREGGPEGLQGVRAIGLWLPGRGVAQVSTNVEDYETTPLGTVLGAVARHALVTATELVGLAPRAALERFPEDVPIRDKRIIEDALSTIEDY
jgi:glutamate formiminotransferase / 5-formyltetrahydrofolate cyclo-ligase